MYWRIVKWSWLQERLSSFHKGSGCKTCSEGCSGSGQLDTGCKAAVLSLKRTPQSRALQKINVVQTHPRHTFAVLRRV